MTELTGDDAPCSDLCYCERAGLIAEVARMREAKRMAGKIADERSRENVALRNEVAHLQFCLNSRDEYLGSIGKWEAYCATLPSGKAGVAGGWAASALEQSAPTPPSFNNVGDILTYLNDDDKQSGTGR